MRGLVVWAAAFYFLWGAVGGGWGFGETRAMIDAVPDEYQGEGFAVMMFVLAVTGAVGAFIGGLIFEWANSLTATAGDAEPTLIYLMVAQSLLICGWFLCRLLRGYRDHPSLTTLVKRLVRR